MSVSALMAEAHRARRINQVFGTNYVAITLSKLVDSHIEELLTFVGFLDGGNTRKGGTGGIDTTQPEAF